MVFYYTGARSFNVAQPNPDLSLGGSLSSTVIPNSKINNIFGDISVFGMQNLRTEVKGMILKNTLGFDVTNVLLGFQYPDNSKFLFEMGVVALDDSNQFIEQINSMTDSPYNCIFYEPFISESEDNSLDLGSMIANSCIGVWMRRTLQKGAVLSDADELALLTTLNSSRDKIINSLKIKLKYDTP